MEAFILLSGWFLVLPSFSCCCWDEFLVSHLESPSIYSPLHFPLLCPPIDKWWRNRPMVRTGAACGWRKLCSNYHKILKPRACGSIDSDFIFSFWLGILIELWVATITTGSPLLSPKHTPLNFLLNQYHLVSMRRERLQILYIKVGIEKFLWSAPGQHPIHSTLWE